MSEQKPFVPNAYSDFCKLATFALGAVNLFLLYVIFYNWWNDLGMVVPFIAWLITTAITNAAVKRGWPDAYNKMMAERAEQEALKASQAADKA